MSFYFHCNTYFGPVDGSITSLTKADDKTLISFLDIPYTGFLQNNVDISVVENILGSDNFATLYTVPGWINVSNAYDKAMITNLYSNIPSLRAAYPIVASQVTSYLTATPPYNNNSFSRYVYVEIPTLSKVVRPGWTPSYDIVNGNWTQSSNPYITSLVDMGNSSWLIMFGYENYSTGDDLTNPDKWYSVYIKPQTTTSISNNFTISQQRLTGSTLTNLISLFTSSTIPDGKYGPVNPYEPATPSGPGDLPPGTFDDTSDPIPWPSLPTISAADTGFTRIYNPTLSQVQDLARYLWTDNNLIGTLWNKIKQFFEDPMQSFIAFNLVPCPVPDGGVEEFQLLFIPTGVNLTTAANQFVDVDCGTCEIPRYYGSALDQTPYTKISCFLPYIGMVALDTDEVIGTTLQVKYRIDIVSGSCVAGILVDGNLLYQYSGHCAITIPLASADFSRYIQAAIAVAGTALGALVPGAGSALSGLMGLAQDAEQQTDYVVTKYYDRTETVRNPETGRQITASGVHTTTRTVYPAEQTTTKASFAGLTPSNIANTVGEVMSAKAAIQHSGSFSGNSGYLGLRRPYLLITRPRMCLPENYQSLNGYPSMITMSLGDCVGYTRVQQVQLTGMHATNPEQAEILELLKTGVVF